MTLSSSSNSSSPFISDEDRKANAPVGPKDFIPKGNRPRPLRSKTAIAGKELCRLYYQFETPEQGYDGVTRLQTRHIRWYYGWTADGRLIGERWAKVELGGNNLCVSETVWESLEDLHAYCCNRMRKHWFAPKVIG